MKLSDGTKLEGRVHPSLGVDGARKMVVRILDLKSAYKQVLVHPSSRWLSVIAVFNPETGRVELYVTEVLPFGATAAVYGFGRLSVALR